MKKDLESSYWKKQLKTYNLLPYKDNEKYLSWQPARWSSNGAVITEILSNITKINTVCELGAGSAAFSLEMFRKNKDLKITAIDKSKIASKYGKKIAKDMNVPINYKVRDFFKIKNKTTFDFVLSLGVIEHFNANDRKKFIQKCIDMSNKYIFIAIPNQESIIFKSYVKWCNKNNNNYEEDHEKFNLNDLLCLIKEYELRPIMTGGFQVYLSESDFLEDTVKENKKYIDKLKKCLIQQDKSIGEKFPNYNFKMDDIPAMTKAELSLSKEERIEMSFMIYILCEKM